jgi:RNA polymerase sigma factor (sigma-70 family)
MEIPLELSQWLHDARAGCREAQNRLAAFAQTYLLQLKGCAISGKWRAQEDRQDLVQKTLSRFFERISRVQGLTPEAALRLLHCIWRRTWSKMIRHHLAQKRAAGREQAWTDAACEGDMGARTITADISPLDALIATERQEQLTKALAQLTEREHQLVIWHAVDNVSFAEIGRRLALTQHVAQQRCRRLCNRLARDLSPRP